MTELRLNLQLRKPEFCLDVDVVLPGAGTTVVLGRSGSGKTSLLRCVAGLERGATGRVVLGDVVWQDEHRFKPVHKRKIGYVFQEAGLFSHLSVEQNLQFGWRRLLPTQRKIALSQLTELLGLEPLISRPVTSLSGGERQRVALGRALLRAPALLLLDEPLAALDQVSRLDVLECLERIQNQLAVPMLYVTHEPREAGRLADHLVIMRQGQVAQTGTLQEVFGRDATGADDAAVSDISSVLNGHVDGHEEDFALSWIQVAGARVGLPRLIEPVGIPVRVQVSASDVSLSLHAHHDTSILNLLPVRIARIKELSRSQALLSLVLQDGQLLQSIVTRRSVSALALRPGSELFAQVKGVAIVK